MIEHSEQPKSTHPSVPLWCRDYRHREYSFDEFLDIIDFFHGHVAPGLVIGGKMVDLAMRHVPEGTLFDSICETANCLPEIHSSSRNFRSKIRNCGT